MDAAAFPRVIVTPDDVSVGWLTAVLRNSGALTQGSVTAFTVDQGHGNWSTNARLRVDYSDDATGERPQHLFLKMTNTDLGDGEYFGPSEVQYYTHDYVDVPDAPLVRWHDAAYSEDLLRYHVLLNDVAATHEDASARPPTLEYGLALADAMAVMHARWWGEQRLAEAGAPVHDARFIKDYVAIAAPGVGYIIDGMADRLEPHWPETLRALVANHPQAIIDRTSDANGFTLIHGDPGEYNILVPREGDRPIYIIDRQPFNWSLTTWLGVYDLAYAIVLDWDSETRRALEMPILERYHEQLVRRGVKDYSWSRLYDDYRLSIGTCVYIPTEYCRGGINHPAMKYWLAMLQRSLTAIDDLSCDELW